MVLALLSVSRQVELGVLAPARSVPQEDRQMGMLTLADGALRSTRVECDRGPWYVGLAGS